MGREGWGGWWRKVGVVSGERGMGRVVEEGGGGGECKRGMGRVVEEGGGGEWGEEVGRRGM